MVGTLIVIDGADGAGKATQTRLLVDRLTREGRTVRSLDFPQYTDNLFGQLIKECLEGRRGDFLGLDARIASVLYAADRFESSPQLREWLAAGDVVILDRYVSSNILHQGGKVIADEKTLIDFLTWLDRMEHEVFGIPRPDLVLYLDVPYSYRQQMLFSATDRTALDMADANAEHQRVVEQSAQYVTARHTDWRRIACVETGQLLSPEKIHARVYAAVKDVFA